MPQPSALQSLLCVDSNTEDFFGTELGPEERLILHFLAVDMFACWLCSVWACLKGACSQTYTASPRCTMPMMPFFTTRHRGVFATTSHGCILRREEPENDKLRPLTSSAEGRSPLEVLGQFNLCSPLYFQEYMRASKKHAPFPAAVLGGRVQGHPCPQHK